MRKQKKKSKITVPNSGETKAKLVAFRPSKDLARLMNKHSNKTKVIEDALHLFFSADHEQTCPTCNGTGKIVRVK